MKTLLILLAASCTASAQAKPNIVLIYADDMGYGEVSCYNPDRNKVPTPHIDKLATQGMRFTDAHSSSGVCSPSRYALLTGRYHWRSSLQKSIVGLWKNSPITPDRLTLGGLTREHGYTTAMSGKWHLGSDWKIPQKKQHLMGNPKQKDKDITATKEQKAFWAELFSNDIQGGPMDRGFDRYFGTDVPNWPPFCYIENRRTIGIPSEFLPSRLFKNNQASNQGPALKDWTLEPILPAITDRACDWIGELSKTDKPFFLYFSLTSPHTPISPNEPWIGKSGLGSYGDFVLETDDSIGRVLAAIDQAGIADNTLVIFTTDNGCAPYIGVNDLEAKGHFPSGPLRGYKSDAWEGGQRVPFIVRWPGKVQPGTVTDQLVHQADIFATVAEILGHDLPGNAGEDSFSLLPLFLNKDHRVRQHAVSTSGSGLPAVRDGHWKYIPGKGSGGWTKGGDTQPVQLYNLADDLGETKNLAAAMPEKVAEMKELLEKLITEGRSTPGPKQQNDVNVIRYPAP